MLVLHSPEDASRVANTGLRELVETRFRQLAEEDGAFDSERTGFMVVVEPGDRLDEIERAAGIDLMADALAERRFGDADFTSAAEAIEEHEGSYELVFVFTDDGYGVEVFVPKAEGIDPQLLAMCRQFAIPPAASQ